MLNESTHNHDDIKWRGADQHVAFDNHVNDAANMLLPVVAQHVPPNMRQIPLHNAQRKPPQNIQSITSQNVQPSSNDVQWIQSQHDQQTTDDVSLRHSVKFLTGMIQWCSVVDDVCKLSGADGLDTGAEATGVSKSTYRQCLAVLRQIEQDNNIFITTDEAQWTKKKFLADVIGKSPNATLEVNKQFIAGYRPNISKMIALHFLNQLTWDENRL